MKECKFPKVGTSWNELRAKMLELRERDVDWRSGRTALHVYYAGEDVLNVAREAYGMFMMENALAPLAFPSLGEMENDLVEAAVGLFQGSSNASGSLTSGGTESIFLALKTARDWTRVSRPNVVEPFEIVLPRTAHPAFDKAAQYLGMVTIRVPTTANCNIDVEQLFEAVNAHTIMVVASAPNFAYGMVDPVPEIAELALERDLWLHVDACVGGFLAPFAKKLGYFIPEFDFSVPGVRSLSADLHKYGYAAKGASLVIFSDRHYAQYQGTEFSDWPKGRYYTPTMLGTRSGGTIAAAWAVLHYLGEDGYLKLASRVMNLWKTYLASVQRIPELTIVGSPHLAILSFASATKELDIFAVANELAGRGWYMSRLAEPAGIHQIVNLAHENAVGRYFDEVESAVRKVFKHSIRAKDRDVVTY
jgi:sphinganine-1-phosphate aldolase